MGLIDRACDLRALRKIPSVEFFTSQSKNAIFALLHGSNSYLFEPCATDPYTAGHFELIEVPKVLKTPC